MLVDAPAHPGRRPGTWAIEQYAKWLRRKSPHTSTAVHYTNDLELFFAWIDKPPDQITLQDIDAFIEHSQQQGHRIATVNRRLAALRSFYHFLEIENDNARPNPVRPKRHFIRQGRRLPRDAQDAEIEKLFAVINDPRDRAMFLLMLRCGLRVGEVRALSLNDLYLQPTPGSLPRLWIQGKGGSQRVAYLSAQPLTALKAWLAIRPPVEDQAVFLNRFARASRSPAFNCVWPNTVMKRMCGSPAINFVTPSGDIWLKLACRSRRFNACSVTRGCARRRSICTSRTVRCKRITTRPCSRSRYACALKEVRDDPQHRQTSAAHQEHNAHPSRGEAHH